MDLTESLTKLTVKQLLESVAGEISVPRHFRKSKAALTTFIIEHLTPTLERKLHDLLATCTAPKAPALVRKRKWEEDLDSSRKASRLDSDDSEDSGEFLELPSAAVRKSCYRKFYEATSNRALEHVVCAVCARERGHQSDRVSSIALDEIPSPACLFPGQPHQKHTLFDGMLLQPEGVMRQGERSFAANACATYERRRNSPPSSHLPTVSGWEPCRWNWGASLSQNSY
jgi:hypothetical protein